MWNPISRLFAQRRPPASNPPATVEIDPIDQLVREAFPRASASEALQARVAALLPAQKPLSRARLLPQLNAPSRWAVALTLGGLLLVAGLSAGRRGPVAYAEDAPTAGSLAIVDKGGNASALCPLKHTAVRAEVSGYVSRVTVEQQFRNPSASPIEAVYTFPLPEDAAVDDMTMILGDRVVKGEIKRKEEARQIYEDARSRGQAAALLDQERPNIFTQQVANIMPGQEVRITISYVNLLKYDEGTYEFTFPMVVGPRFTTGSSGYTVPGQRGEPSTNRRVEGDPGPTSVETDAEKITPPITPKGTRAGHNISVSVHLNAGVPLQEVKSPLHSIDTRREGDTQATVTLKDQDEIPNRDFILRFRTAGREIETGVLAHAPEAGKSGYFTLILQPPNAPPRDEVSGKEMVFVIDQTGSQSGEPIEKAKDLMRTCIRRLNPQDTFQLIGFNTDVFPCFPAPVKNTPENVKKALEFLAPLQGEGGTDILKSVDWALTMPDDPDRLRMICYMTDGYVGNDFQILDYIRKHRGRARMFPFGIGNSVNRFLIENMGKEGRGASEIVDLTADAKAVADKFYRRVSQPLLLDPSIDWGGLPVADVYPQVIPDVFTSAPIIVKGRYTRGAEGDLTVHGFLRGKPWSQTVHVRFPEVEPANSAIPTLWARQKIEDLQAQDYLGQQMGRADPNIKDQIVNLALDYRLMTEHTSFVAVEARVVNIGGHQRTVDVPVEMPQGVRYDGIFGERKDSGIEYADATTVPRKQQITGPVDIGFAANPQPQRSSRGFADGHRKGGSGSSSRTGNGNFTAPDVDTYKELASDPEPKATLYWQEQAKPEPAPVPLPAAASAAPRGRRNGSPYPAAAGKSAPAMLPGRSFVRRNPFSENSDLKHSLTVIPKQKSRARPYANNLMLHVEDSPSMSGFTDFAFPDDGKADEPGVVQHRKRESLRKQIAGGQKLAPGLMGATGTLEIQFWIGKLPPDGLKQLQKLGFTLAAELRPGQLLLGTLPAERLQAVAKLPWVLYVERPKYK